MALTTTTLAAAVGVSDTSVVLTSATGVAAGSLLLVGANEYMQVRQDYTSGVTVPVLRGKQSTKVVAHVVTENVNIGTGEDFSLPAVQLGGGLPIAGRARTISNYVASGAIAFPTPGNDAVAILIGTSTLTMTLANPTKDMDGSILWIIGNGKSTSTVTYTAGFGNAGGNYDIVTLPAGGAVCIAAMACNGFWVALSPFTGTLTSIFGAIA